MSDSVTTIPTLSSPDHSMANLDAIAKQVGVPAEVLAHAKENADWFAILEWLVRKSVV